MARTYHFTVEGRGSFPVDMLRYDCCWPRRESEDVPEVQGMPPRPKDKRVAEKARQIVQMMQDKPELMREVLRQLMGLHDDALFNGTRKVDLVGHHKPTEGRWESFGWKVVATESRR